MAKKSNMKPTKTGSYNNVIKKSGSKSVKKNNIKPKRNKTHKHKLKKAKITKNNISYNNKRGGSMKTCACVDYDVIDDRYSLQNNTTAKGCQNKPNEGTDFCDKHQKCPNFMIMTQKNGNIHTLKVHIIVILIF
jgi:hypothetical protein